MDTWLEVLQAEVAASSLAVVADKLGLSRTTISQVCNEKYPGDLARVQKLVEGNLMGHKVICPILGEIPVHQCLAYQRRRADEVGTRPMDIKLWKACHSGCPIASSARISNCAGRCVSPSNWAAEEGTRASVMTLTPPSPDCAARQKAMVRTPATACAFWQSCWPKSSRS